MRRRAFLTSGAAAALSAPALLTLAGPAAALPVRRGRAAGPLRLASNENPLGMPASVQRAIEAGMADGNRYPALAAEVTRAVAAHLQLQPANVVLGNGSTEILQVAVQHVASRGGRIVLPDPTFEHLERYARPFPAAEVVKVPLTAEHQHDLPRMRAAAAGAAPTLVFICNPNNPTGGITDCAAVEEWLLAAPEHVTFVVDEAYFEFVRAPEYRTMLPLIAARRNLLVIRTFSKAYGMAGLRLGYGLGHPDMIATVRAFLQLSNLNHFALVGALAALQDQEFVQRSLAVNAESQRVAEAVLDELDIERLPSHANFLMHRVRGELGGHIERMRERGILVGRPFPPMTGYNRVSLGTPGEMRVWGETLREFRAQNWI